MEMVLRLNYRNLDNSKMRQYVLTFIVTLLAPNVGCELIGRWVCHYPCQCPVRELNCVEGIPVVKDGCGCCYMCARQHGDTCSVKDVCDVKRGFFCDMTASSVPGTGICKANNSKPCEVDGKSYPDGEKFQPECSRMCTCQNGNYGCVDLCPDEYRIPSSTHCQRPRLLAVPGQCCKQWTCEEVSEEKPVSNTDGISPRHIPQQKMQQLEMQSYTRHETGRNSEQVYQNAAPQCTEKETAWSECSSTCGIGVSRKSRTDTDCSQTKQTRLCYLRPCDVDIPTKGKKCTPTSRSTVRKHIKYEDCVSMIEWRLKYCTTCKTKRCCYPIKEKTKAMEFQCGDGRRQMFDFMWVKRCRCDRQCYKKDTHHMRSNRRRKSRRYTYT